MGYKGWYVAGEALVNSLRRLPPPSTRAAGYNRDQREAALCSGRITRATRLSRQSAWKPESGP